VLVRDIDPGSPADDAGVQPYDVILSIDGETIDTREDYVARIYDYRPGDEIRIRIRRNGDALTLPMRLGRQE